MMKPLGQVQSGESEASSPQEPETEPRSQNFQPKGPTLCVLIFTNQRAGKAVRLTGGARALGTAIAKRVDAWLLA